MATCSVPRSWLERVSSPSSLVSSMTGIPVQTYVPVGLISPSILTIAAEKRRVGAGLALFVAAAR